MRSDFIVYGATACMYGVPGPCAYGVVTLTGGGEIVARSSGAYEETTTNRMELMGLLAGLDACAAGSSVEVRTTSFYVYNGLTRWLDLWTKNGWVRIVRGKPEPIANIDLWKLCKEAAGNYRITLSMLRGKASENEWTKMARVEALAKIEQTPRLIDQEFTKGVNSDRHPEAGVAT